MNPIQTLKDLQRKVSFYEQKEKAIGILFARPQLSIARDSIISQLNYYNNRSGEYIDFFLPGLIQHDNGKYHDIIEVGTLNSNRIYYSDRVFVEFVDEMEKISTWHYYGQTELLIVNVKNQNLDFSKTLSFDFEDALNKKAIQSTSRFMETLIQLSKEKSDDSNLQRRLSGKALGFIAIETFLENIPYHLGERLQAVPFYKSKDFSR